MKKIVITGGFGFIGARLVKHFQQKNIEVVVLEHPASKVPEGFPQCEIVRGDITERAFIGAVKVYNVDAVLHLAAQSSGPRSFVIPETDIKINILGTLNIIDWCIANKIDRLLFASSFVIYGDHPEKEALAEDTVCIPKSVYATSKLACEHLLTTYAQVKGLNWSALRMFNVYGQGQDITKPDQGVVGIFMNMLLRQDTVKVKGSLQRFRDLIHVDDVIQGWDLCLHSTVYNQSYNLGSGVKTTYHDLIVSLAKVIGKADSLKIEELPGTPGDMMGCFADITKIKSELGYEPKFDLEKGIATMYEWVIKNKIGQ
jgi:UDP-glucose 4-epimerase